MTSCIRLQQFELPYLPEQVLHFWCTSSFELSALSTGICYAIFSLLFLNEMPDRGSLF